MHFYIGRPPHGGHQPTHLRDAAGDAVRFDEINAFTARLLALLEDGACSGRDALSRLASESRHPDPARILEAGQALLEDLRARGAILGTRSDQ